MQSFRKYNIIGFCISLILHFFLVFVVIKFAFMPFRADKISQINDENILTIQLQNFEIYGSEFNEILNDLQNEFENLQSEIEFENLEKEFEKIDENSIQKEVANVDFSKTVKPKENAKKSKVQKTRNLSKNSNSNNTNLKESQNLANLSNLQSRNLANSDISAKIKAIISQYAKKNYPKNAKNLRQTGVVEIGFYLTDDKKIENLQILKSSGFASLDEAALNAVKKSKSKFPQPAKTDYFKFGVSFTLIN